MKRSLERASDRWGDTPETEFFAIRLEIVMNRSVAILRFNGIHR